MNRRRGIDSKKEQSSIIFQKKNSKGQSQISFGMIFSIILIVFFIGFAIFAVLKFIPTTRIAQVESFKSDFQVDINNMCKSTQRSQRVEYFLPNQIDQVCFANRQFENMYFVPENKFKGYVVDHLNITGTILPSTLTPKRLCIDNSKGKVSMIIKKAYNQNLVTVVK